MEDVNPILHVEVKDVFFVWLVLIKIQMDYVKNVLTIAEVAQIRPFV